MDDTINNTAYAFDKEILQTPVRLESFFALAERIFGLSFRAWHAAGYFTDAYIPYTLSLENQVVANVSVNVMDFLIHGSRKRYVQLGTVMTDPAFQKQGLSAFLLKKVLREWKERCDAIYLYANDDAQAFYPKFGFIPAQEYAATLPLSFLSNTPNIPEMRKLNLVKEADFALFAAIYQKGNPFATIVQENDFPLLLFHCLDAKKETIYYFPSHQSIIIAEMAGNILCCDAIFSPNDDIPLFSLLSAIAGNGCTAISFGFSLKNAAPASLLPIAAPDTTLFLYQEKENLFAQEKTMLPILSHA
ncbi:MAG: GNAT family N-acetyltransferase [Christensenellaceae bacterium]